MVKIIVNPNVTTLEISSDDVKGIFLMSKTTLRDGAAIEPVLEREGPAYIAFLKQYMGKTDEAMTTYYRSLVFIGKAPMPSTLNSDVETVAYVAKNKAAIGFVGADSETHGVKILRVK